MKKLLVLMMLMFQISILKAQQVVNDNVEMADNFRQDGKIYVVVAVVVIIFAGILIYLFSLDNKIKKLEKEFKEKN